MAVVGVIGGSGVYDLVGLTSVRELEIETPFGAPSGALLSGELDGARVVFLARHGRGHRLSPTHIPYRANIWAMKSAGVDTLIAVSAVGSMREDVHPGDMLLADQFIDRTHARDSSFFGEGIVAHVSMAEPTCAPLRALLAEAVRGVGVRLHERGAYVCIEGPAFSSRAESRMYRSFGVDVIGMTAMPEAKLAREAELHYSTVALVTDYDCWHSTEEDVSVDAVIATVKKNADNLALALKRAIPAIARVRVPGCSCASSLKHAIMTDPSCIDDVSWQRLHAIVAKYVTRS